MGDGPGHPASDLPGRLGYTRPGCGPIRNHEMAEYVGPGGLCILFPGGRGTASMRREALAVGLTVIEASDKQ